MRAAGEPLGDANFEPTTDGLSADAVPVNQELEPSEE
jgi:hypothetical protein